MNRLESDQCDDNVVIVVSPLEYIHVQQVESLKQIGVCAVFLGHLLSETHGLYSEEGFAQLLYRSAEQWLSDMWANKLKQGELGNVQVLVIDEVHTVDTW
jgi:superfamily II DNA helicase RecQ